MAVDYWTWHPGAGKPWLQEKWLAEPELLPPGGAAGGAPSHAAVPQVPVEPPDLPALLFALYSRGDGDAAMEPREYALYCMDAAASAERYEQKARHAHTVGQPGADKLHAAAEDQWHRAGTFFSSRARAPRLCSGHKLNRAALAQRSATARRRRWPDQRPAPRRRTALRTSPRRPRLRRCGASSRRTSGGCGGCWTTSATATAARSAGGR